MAVPTPEQALTSKKDAIDYALPWLRAMIEDEAKAAEDYGKFGNLMEEGAAKFASNPLFAQLLRDTATTIGTISTDELKHHAALIRVRSEFERHASSNPGNPHGEGMDLEDELKRQDALLDDYLFFGTGVDGIVVNPTLALNPNVPCKCVDIPKTGGAPETVCWKKGIIGLVGADEVPIYCPPQSRTEAKGGARLAQRLSRFRQASERCTAMGAASLEDRLACMAASLRTGGVELGQTSP